MKSGPAGSGCLKSWAVTGPKGDRETDELLHDRREKGQPYVETLQAILYKQGRRDKEVVWQ